MTAVLSPLAALSESRTLFEAGLIFVLAAAAPLIAQAIRAPSILVLLALGFGAGAIGALDPNALLGEAVVSATVSIAVGIILFDSGLELDLGEVRGAVARVYRRLVSLGILVTWVIATVSSQLLFGLSWEVALVLGAVLVVSGPTVVGPLLAYIRPSKNVNRVLKWEGTLADPIGATLGVVVFQAVVAGQAAPGQEILEFMLNIGVGVGLGILGAVIVIGWGRWFDPNEGQATTGILMVVVATVVAADLLRDDAGLLTGLTIGVIMANRVPGRIEPRGLRLESAKLARAWKDRIATTSTFLIGILFIILSARVSPDDIADIGWVSLAFVAVLVLIARPLAVGLSAMGSTLKRNERAFIAWMAPRGIVAAATSSTFALGLEKAGIGGGSEKLIPITFVVIVAAALIYGLSGAPVARALGVSRTGPGGVLVCGNTIVARSIARALRDQSIPVVLWTGGEETARAARDEGLTVYSGDPTAAASANPPPELEDVEKVLIAGDDDGLNAMLATDLGEAYGRGSVYQLATGDDDDTGFFIRANLLFTRSATHDRIAARLESGGSIHRVEAEPGRPEESADGELAMFVLEDDGRPGVLTAGSTPEIEAGDGLIVLSGGSDRSAGAR